VATQAATLDGFFTGQICHCVPFLRIGS
jgi:hypothetical protein